MGFMYIFCSALSTPCLYQVYQEFEIASVSNDAKGPFSVEKPKGGYDKEVYSHGA